jgi:farnesyl-diphosphate farnesyltransferase
LAIPARETGIRNFCLWALFMAVLTQRKLLARPAFARGAEVKIRRSSVRLAVAWCRAAARSDAALRASFAFLTRGLPCPSADELVLAPMTDGEGAAARFSS